MPDPPEGRVGAPMPRTLIVTPTYMISEKASDAVLADAGVPVAVPA